MQHDNSTNSNKSQKKNGDNAYIMKKHNMHFSGIHIIADLYGAHKIDCLETMEEALRSAVLASKATLLHTHLHHFNTNSGISGVAVLAESHISVHTWPEANYAAFDVFMCGKTNPEKAIDIFMQTFTPKWISITEHLRGKNIEHFS